MHEQKPLSFETDCQTSMNETSLEEKEENCRIIGGSSTSYSDGGAIVGWESIGG